MSNLKVNLGRTKGGEDFILDFKDQVNLVLLVGASGTGKSVLGYHIYRQLVEQNTPDRISFVLIDNPKIEFVDWNQKSPYLYYPNITDQNLALEILEKLANSLSQINTELKHYFIHIEESDLFTYSYDRTEKALKQLLAQKEDSKVHIIFSTSRPTPDIMSQWLLDLVDVQASLQQGGIGEKVIHFNGKVMRLLPLTAQESELAQKFKLFSLA